MFEGWDLYKIYGESQITADFGCLSMFTDE